MSEHRLTVDELEFEREKRYEFFIKGRVEGLIADLEKEGNAFLTLRPVKKPRETLFVAKANIDWARLIPEVEA